MCHSAPDWPRLSGMPLSGGQLFDESQQKGAQTESPAVSLTSDPL